MFFFFLLYFYFRFTVPAAAASQNIPRCTSISSLFPLEKFLTSCFQNFNPRKSLANSPIFQPPLQCVQLHNHDDFLFSIFDPPTLLSPHLKSSIQQHTHVPFCALCFGCCPEEERKKKSDQNVETQAKTKRTFFCFFLYVC